MVQAHGDKVLRPSLLGTPVPAEAGRYTGIFAIQQHFREFRDTWRRPTGNYL